jgi:chromosome segregation ATPase
MSIEISVKEVIGEFKDYMRDNFMGLSGKMDKIEGQSNDTGKKLEGIVEQIITLKDAIKKNEKHHDIFFRNILDIEKLHNSLKDLIKDQEEIKKDINVLYSLKERITKIETKWTIIVGGISFIVAVILGIIKFL